MKPGYGSTFAGHVSKVMANAIGYLSTVKISVCSCSYLSAVPGPPHQDLKLLMEVQDLAPPGGRTADLQQQTVPTTGHRHIRRSQHSFGDDRQAGKGPLHPRHVTCNLNTITLAKKNNLS